MTKGIIRIAAVGFLLALASTSVSLAGPYADDLTKCLVDSTTEKDRTDLIRWLFVSAALHPDVSGVTTVTDKQRTEMTKTVGQLLERLLTHSCRSEFRSAVRFEGSQTVEISFGVLGQVAMKGLLEHPAVAKGLGELETYVDQNKISAVMKDKDR